MKTYLAMIAEPESKGPGRRVTVVADSLQDARDKLEADYGEGTVFDLHNEDDAVRGQRSMIGRAPVSVRYSAAAMLVRSGSTSALTTIVSTTTAALSETLLTAQRGPCSACSTRRRQTFDREVIRARERSRAPKGLFGRNDDKYRFPRLLDD